MKWRFTVAKIIEEGGVVNLKHLPSDMGEFSEFAIDENTILRFNHTTKKWSGDKFYWDDDQCDWVDAPDLTHKEAFAIALESGIIYKTGD